MKRKGILKVFSAAAVSALLVVCTGVYANAAEPDNTTPILPIGTEQDQPLELSHSWIPQSVYAGDTISLDLAATGGDGNYTYVFSHKGQNDDDYIEDVRKGYLSIFIQ